jgi:uncharacterized protein
MKYQDKIYGTVKIDEPLVLELIKCPSMQRLKGVDQHGHFEPFFPGTAFSRFEHSVGVFILLRKFNAPFLEQIAGLLHDISHTAFSHVADYVFRDGSGQYQNFQDEELEGFIKNSEIPEILKKYNINYKDILDDSKFLLKERELPDLCADRIDYFLRDSLAFKRTPQKEIDEFLNNLAIIKNNWVFKDKNIAKKYAYLFLDVNNIYWSGLESGVMLKSMGELIKYALDKRVIEKQDLFLTDNEFWAKLRPFAEKDKKLELLLDRADNKYKYAVGDKDNYDLHSLNKSRSVDPVFLENGKLKRVSEIDEKFKVLNEKFSKPKEYYIKFLQKR